MVLIFLIWISPLSTKRSKSLLNSVDFIYTETDLSNDNDRQNFYEKVGEGVSTVPQIFIEDYHVGGHVELRALENTGELDNLIK